MLYSNWFKHFSFIYCFAHPSKISKTTEKFNSLSPTFTFVHIRAAWLDYACPYPERQSTLVIAFAVHVYMDTAGDLFKVASLLPTCSHLGFAVMISSFSWLSSLMPGFFDKIAFANAQNGPIIMCHVISPRPVSWLTSNARWIIPRLFLK